MQKYLLPAWLIRAGFHTAQTLSANRYPLAAPSGTLFCEQPLFIISSGRAGTTLLRSMLVASGQIAIPQEFPVVHDAVWYFLRNQQRDDWATLCQHVAALIAATPEFDMWNLSLDDAVDKAAALPTAERSLARIIDLYLQHYTQAHFPDAHAWGDQSPLHTFYTSWIQPLYPQARFLHLMRDGRDVVSSFLKRGDLSLQESTARWCTSIERAHALRDRLPAAQYLDVRYEDIVQQPEAELQRIAPFIGIEYTPRMLEYWKLDSTVEHKHLSYHENIGKPVFSSSVSKWKERLTDEQKRYVWYEMAPLLERLGYLKA